MRYLITLLKSSTIEKLGEETNETGETWNRTTQVNDKNSGNGNYLFFFSPAETWIDDPVKRSGEKDNGGFNSGYAPRRHFSGPLRGFPLIIFPFLACFDEAGTSIFPIPSGSFTIVSLIGFRCSMFLHTRLLRCISTSAPDNLIHYLGPRENACTVLRFFVRLCLVWPFLFLSGSDQR